MMFQNSYAIHLVELKVTEIDVEFQFSLRLNIGSDQRVVIYMTSNHVPYFKKKRFDKYSCALSFR